MAAKEQVFPVTMISPETGEILDAWLPTIRRRI